MKDKDGRTIVEQGYRPQGTTLDCSYPPKGGSAVPPVNGNLVDNLRGLEIVWIPLHEIKPYEHNAKRHPITQLEGITKSIQEFGFLQNIVVDKNGVIICGHGRYEALAALGAETIPCVVADHLTDEQVHAYRLLDNELARTGWDNEQLAYDLSLTDYDFSKFGVEFNGLAFPDEAAEPEEKKKERTYKLTVTFQNETHMEDLYEELTLRGFSCKK